MTRSRTWSAVSPFPCQLHCTWAQRPVGVFSTFILGFCDHQTKIDPPAYLAGTIPLRWEVY